MEVWPLQPAATERLSSDEYHNQSTGLQLFCRGLLLCFFIGSTVRMPPCPSGGTVQGDGFDTHYAAYQVSQMVQMITMMNVGGGTYANQCSTNIGASCIRSRGGIPMRWPKCNTAATGFPPQERCTVERRHNEIAGSSTDISFGTSYNFFGSILNADLGRATISNDKSTGTEMR